MDCPTRQPAGSRGALYTKQCWFCARMYISRSIYFIICIYHKYIFHIYTLYTICILRIIEGSLEVKLPTIWRDGKAEVGRVREEKIRDGEDQRGRKPEERRCFTPYHPAPGASSRRLCQGCATRACDDLVLVDGSHRNTLEAKIDLCDDLL